MATVTDENKKKFQLAAQDGDNDEEAKYNLGEKVKLRKKPNFCAAFGIYMHDFRSLSLSLCLPVSMSLCVCLSLSVSLSLIYMHDFSNFLDWSIIGLVFFLCYVWIWKEKFLTAELVIKSRYGLESAFSITDFDELLVLLDTVGQWFVFYQLAAGLLLFILIVKVVICMALYPPLQVILRTLSGSAYGSVALSFQKQRHRLYS
jgi:hypothetical protein